jgi:hypothetical protein
VGDIQGGVAPLFVQASFVVAPKVAKFRKHFLDRLKK